MGGACSGTHRRLAPQGLSRGCWGLEASQEALVQAGEGVYSKAEVIPMVSSEVGASPMPHL